MTTILDEICATKREHVQRSKATMPEAALLKEVVHAPPPRGFMNALKAKTEQGAFGLIAEIKKASPSAGLIREPFDAHEIAAAYEMGGATCLSVLTDTLYFQGNDWHLEEAKRAASLPILRKDFMLEPYQIIESRILGADCVLLIMAALSDEQAAELLASAHDMALDVLVEVHDATELERAVTLGAAMIGINNRNLKTMEVDLAISESLAHRIPTSCLPVCESGIHTHNDLLRLQKSGIASFLVGESLMRQRDITKATQALLGNV